MKKFSFIIIAFAMLVAFTGVVIADTGVPAVPEHQGIATTTVANVDGMVMESDATAMTLTNNPTSVMVAATAVGVAAPVNIGGGAAFLAFQQQVAQLTALGGSITWHAADGTNPAIAAGTVIIDSVMVPPGALNVNMVAGPLAGPTFGAFWAGFIANPGVTTSTINQGIHTGMLSPGQVQYSTTYGLDIVAQNGLTSMQKTNKITTENTLPGQSNLDMPLSLTFIATADGGNVHGTEDIMLDGAAQAQTTANVMLCPFGPATVGPVIPPFCNIVQAGGEFDLTVGSVTTAANERFIQTDATNPVVLNYEINVKPYSTSEGQIPAIGSASAYYKAHIQEGRTASNTVSEDLTSSEETSVSGIINGFTKKISYQSGPKLV